MDVIANLSYSVGHAAQLIQQSTNVSWKRAGSGSPTTNLHYLHQLEQEADQIEKRIEAMVEADPDGASTSVIGHLHLMKWGFLCNKADKTYPYKFDLRDVMVVAPYIAAQLVADEYFMRGKESTPFTPEAFLGFDFERNRRYRNSWNDPFLIAPEKRADVTIEATDAGGKTYTYNQNPTLKARSKPAEGFANVS